MMGVVHVRGYRWPSTIKSMPLRIVHILFKGTVLGVGHGRVASTV
jgi:hypothetical protein